MKNLLFYLLVLSNGFAGQLGLYNGGTSVGDAVREYKYQLSVNGSWVVGTISVNVAQNSWVFVRIPEYWDVSGTWYPVRVRLYSENVGGGYGGYVGSSASTGYFDFSDGNNRAVRAIFDTGGLEYQIGTFSGAADFAGSASPGGGGGAAVPFITPGTMGRLFVLGAQWMMPLALAVIVFHFVRKGAKPEVLP